MMIHPSVVWWRAKVPFTEPRVSVEILTLFKDQDPSTLGLTAAYYLHGVRSDAGRVMRQQNPEAFHNYELLYNANLSTFTGMLSNALWTAEIRNAIGLRPPSSRNDAEPYIRSAIERGLLAANVSECLSRIHAEFRAGSSSDYATVKAAIQVDLAIQCPTASTLLIFDDVLASGRSVAATAEVVLEAGIIEKGARIVIVAPLHIRGNIYPTA